jgi:hypothetical protein
MKYKIEKHDATSVLFLLRMPSKITLVYIYKNHMMRNRRRIMTGFYCAKITFKYLNLP